jgi:hypothetical protein
MSEGDYTPRAGRLKPLTRAQLSEMQERFAKVSGHLNKIKELEKQHDEGDIEKPEWV